MATGGQGPDDSDSGRGQRPRPNININVKMKNPTLIKVADIRDVVFNNNIVLLNVPFNFMSRPAASDDNVHDEALRDFPPCEDLTPKFRPEDLERQVEEKFFIPVARAFEEHRGCRWLARKLKIDPPVMSKLNMWHINNLHELVYQVMVAWKRVNPTATVRVLVKALCESRNQKQALVLKDFLEENNTSEEKE